MDMIAMEIYAQTWWHLEGWPNAAEWQAFWAFIGALATGGALVFALFQLSGIKKQNEIAATAAMESARANEIAALAAAQSVRPYVQLDLLLEKQTVGNPKEESGEGVAYLRLRNNGRTPARNLTLLADPPFENSGRGKPDDAKIDVVAEGLRTIFSGETEISMLSPGQEIKYFLDYATQLMDKNSDRPKKYEVSASYFGTDLGIDPYVDKFHIDPMPVSYSVAEIEPIRVIARQMRRRNEMSEREKDASS